MKTLGLIGGTSWESTVIYYQLLNRMAREALGGLHSAELLLWSFDFADIAALQASGDWDAATARMVDVARRLERGGAEGIVICANTMHKMANEVEAAVDVPLIHIADATAGGIRETASKSPLLLATRYTMEQDFYRGRLAERHGIEARIPSDEGRTLVHDVIYEELCRGIISPASKERYLELIREEQAQGADGVVLGCTEVGLLIGPEDVDLPVFDSAELHARAAMDFALSE